MRGHQSSGARPEHPVSGLVVQRPINIFLRLCLQPRVVEKVCERHQPVEKVRAALPRLTRAAQPSARGADIRPGFIEMPSQAIRLNPQLRLQPTGGTNGAEWQRIKRALRKRCAIFYRGLPGMGRE
jgi:hypothetical protein